MKKSTIEQTGLAVFGLTAVFVAAVLQRPWGCLFGLASQPFWFATAWRHRQWGVFALSVAYTAVWASGVARWLGAW